MRLTAAVDRAGENLDFLLLDTATGIGDTVLDVIGLADYVLVITSYDPAAVVDAYAVIKLVSAANAEKPIGVVVNSARTAEEGGLVFRQISLAADRFLGRTLRYDGHVLEDRLVKESVFAQAPLMGSGVKGVAQGCIRRLATRLTAARAATGPWPMRPVPPDGVTRTMEAPRCA
jgi:flagellar biosynthesis protein FlhG